MAVLVHEVIHKDFGHCPVGSGLSWRRVTSEKLPENALLVGPGQYIVCQEDPAKHSITALLVSKRTLKQFDHLNRLGRRFWALTFDHQELTPGTQLYWRHLDHKTAGPDWQSKVVWCDSIKGIGLACNKERPVRSESKIQTVELFLRNDFTQNSSKYASNPRVKAEIGVSMTSACILVHEVTPKVEASPKEEEMPNDTFTRATVMTFGKCPVGSALSWVRVRSGTLPDNAVNVGPFQYLVFQYKPGFGTIKAVPKNISCPDLNTYIWALVHDAERMDPGTRLYWRQLDYKNTTNWQPKVVWTELAYGKAWLAARRDHCTRKTRDNITIFTREERTPGRVTLIPTSTSNWS